MEENFNIVLDNAIKRCEGLVIYDKAFNKGFSQIYPFATENISGYIDKFDLKDKSLLTVGSSDDQVINAILYGCKKISVLDINPYTKFYYYLKIASILDLNLHEFMTFLRFKRYPSTFKDNKNVFNRQLYNKIKTTLRNLDYESYLFWDELFQSFNPIDIRNNLFSLDEDHNRIITKSNPYLQNQDSYELVRNKLKTISPTFIIEDLFKVELQEKYDNIWLSNIGTYLSRHFVKIMTDKLSKSLNNNGQLLISYLYKTTKDTKYHDDWSPIYDLEKVFSLLKEYNPNLISFIGVDGLKFEDSDSKDAILVYRKQ